ncbi:putative mediator of RNA polymerase II transcription subunit 15 [Plutella xylostella]|uniref:putative mediator of RNA polymerase II transcription subunit 15 n=1 Tax=Plutella xylostella TaxID=51655 RepID=UPI0020321A3E|nr:putative mediator of RNA polymerase II transcription subunit 15 [Plutella xylostella]
MITKKCIYFVMVCFSINRVFSQTPPKVPQLFLPNPSVTIQQPSTQTQNAQKPSDVPLTIKALNTGLPKSTQCGSCTETLSNIVQFLAARDVQKASTSTIAKDVEETKEKLMKISKQSVLDSASDFIREILERNYKKQASGQTIYTNNPAAPLLSKPIVPQNPSKCVKLTFTPNTGPNSNYAGNPIQPNNLMQATTNPIQPLFSRTSAIKVPIQNIVGPVQTLANPLQSITNKFQPSGYPMRRIGNLMQPSVNPTQIRPNPVVQYVRQNPVQYNTRYPQPNSNQYPLANQNTGYINNLQRPQMYTNICGSLPVNNGYLNKQSNYFVNNLSPVPNSRCGNCLANQNNQYRVLGPLYGQRTI